MGEELVRKTQGQLTSMGTQYSVQTKFGTTLFPTTLRNSTRISKAEINQLLLIKQVGVTFRLSAKYRVGRRYQMLFDGSGRTLRSCWETSECTSREGRSGVGGRKSHPMCRSYHLPEPKVEIFKPSLSTAKRSQVEQRRGRSQSRKP